MTTYYAIDTRTNEIVNAIESDRVPTLDPARWVSAEHLRLDKNPPLAMLQRYEFWDHRP